MRTGIVVLSVASPWERVGFTGRGVEDADVVLVCVGRREFRDGLGAEEVGVELEGRKVKATRSDSAQSVLSCFGTWAQPTAKDSAKANESSLVALNIWFLMCVTRWTTPSRHQCRASMHLS